MRRSTSCTEDSKHFDNDQVGWGGIPLKPRALVLGAVTEIEALRATETEMLALTLQLNKLRNDRDDRSQATWQRIKRVRSSVKGAYGDDSSQYEMIGGTRMSDRQRAARKKKDES